MKQVSPHWLGPRIAEGFDTIEGMIWAGYAVTKPEILAEKGLRIVLIVEPRATWSTFYSFIEEVIELLDLVITFDARLLSHFPEKTRRFEFGTTWIPQPVWSSLDGITPAKPGIHGSHVSFLTTAKRVTLGHKIRNKIWISQGRLETELGRRLYFMRSSHDDPPLKEAIQGRNPILRTTKDAVHLPVMFSIIVENSNEDFYFSEKLIDCLICKTVPLYWGCPAVTSGNYFNPAGILRLEGNTPAEVYDSLLKILNRCTRPTYESMLPAIEENYKKAVGWAESYPDRARRRIAEYLDDLKARDGLLAERAAGLSLEPIRE